MSAHREARARSKVPFEDKAVNKYDKDEAEREREEREKPDAGEKKER